MNDGVENKIKELEDKVAELENNWKRALADYRNLEKRTEEDKESLISFLSAVLIKRFLGILDNLELLEKHSKNSDESLKMIIKDFKQVLTEEGVTEVEAQDKIFDHATMEAIESVKGELNVVMEVLNKGYMLKDKLLRPARVKVGSDLKEGQ